MFPKIVKPAAVRRDAFLDVAQRLFASEGYDATSVSRIIAELGASKGAFYHYFEAKEDLIEALACRYAQRSAAEAEAVLADPTLDSFSRLAGFLASMRRHKVETAAELRATFEPLLKTENLQLFERTHKAVTNVVRPLLTRIIVEGVAEQTFDTPDPENAADTILHLLSSNRDMMFELYAARNTMEFAAASQRLVAKYVYLGTVIDRMLGLPEGSIVLVDEETMCLLADSVAATGDAA